MKLIFAGGGTAGHVNPAIAVADYITKRHDAEICFMGVEGKIEEKLVPRAGYKLVTFPVTGLSRSISVKGLAQNVKALRNVAAAVRVAKELISAAKPDLVVGTGGYACFPAVYAAQRLGVPTALIEANAVPGLAIRRLAPHAEAVLVPFEDSVAQFSGCKRVVVTGNPVREEILRCREMCYEPLFDTPLPLVSSFWGSVGALYMNKKMEGFIKLAAERGTFNHIHAAGSGHYGWMTKEIAELGVDLQNTKNVDLREYIYDMDRVLALSDLVICRGGGGLAEVCAAGCPSIIVPSPHVAENHQEKNARVLERAGAAVVITESECTDELLYNTAEKLLADPGKLAEMRKAALSLARPQALEDIYATLMDVIGSKR